MLKVLKETPKFLRIETEFAENPHMGISAFPFMKRTIGELLIRCSI
jgi:hypothetical protein